MNRTIISRKTFRSEKDQKVAPTETPFVVGSKIRYHYMGDDGSIIASLPSFATVAACKELIKLGEQAGFNDNKQDTEYSQSTTDLEVDKCDLVRDFLLENNFVDLLSSCMLSTHGCRPAAFDDIFIVKYDATVKEGEIISSCYNG